MPIETVDDTKRRHFSSLRGHPRELSHLQWASGSYILDHKAVTCMQAVERALLTAFIDFHRNGRRMSDYTIDQSFYTDLNLIVGLLTMKSFVVSHVFSA